ncbi:uncharacterized protein [Diadema antillarum]|uniref:uncharacterized protein n=1 Tax=Diadema antillarum TaxID=105358 RepID=UPI003A8431D8
MAVENPVPIVSHDRGSHAASKHAKHLTDIRVSSQKLALQHTVRAKKLDERQLFKFLKSLEDSKSRRLLQIDKEVAEVEKLLKRLNSEQRENCAGSGDDLSDFEGEDGGEVTKSADAGARQRRGVKKKQTVSKMSKEFDEYAFRARQKRGSIDRLGKNKADKLLNAYYRFDSEGNRRLFSPLISSPSKTPKPPARVAWDSDLFPEDISVSNYTVATGTDSRINSGTNRSFMSFADDVFDDDVTRADTITPGRAIFMTSGKFSSQSVRKSSKTHRSKSVKIATPQGVDSMPSSRSRSRKVSRTSENGDRRERQREGQVANDSVSVASKSSVGSDSHSKVPVINVTSDKEDDIPLNFKRSRLKLKRRPTNLAQEVTVDQPKIVLPTENADRNDELQRASTRDACTGASCQIADCIFHRPHHLRRQSTMIEDPQSTFDEYYRVASATHSRATGQPIISPMFQTAEDREWSQARRLPVSPPSPTPSEILADVVIEREEVAEKPDYTDLDVMLSVRRPIKGSNRDRMLKDKEENIKNTFKIMRQKMAASIPPDFNTNYGVPTPNWKILNPLKMRHKIAHSSPLFTLWKLN